MMNPDDLDRELLEAEALASECDTPEAWESAIALRTGDAKVTVVPSDKAEAVAPTPAPNHVLPTEQLSHPSAPQVTNLPDVPPDHVPQVNVPDEAGELDEEYWTTFNATTNEVKDLEPEKLQELRHRLDRMIRRAKIQMRAIRVTEEGKLQFIEEKRRAKIREKDTEFMAKRKVAEGDATQTGARERKARKDAAQAVSQVEKQVKQFVKLNMDENTIRATLTTLKSQIPDDLTAMIAKYRK